MNGNNGSFSLEVARGYLTSGIWGNIGKALSFLNSLLVIYFLSVYDFGVYKLVLAFVGFAQIFLFSGFDGVVFNDVARLRGDGDKRGASRTFLEYAASKLIISLLLLLAAVTATTGLFRIASLLVLLYSLGDIMEVFFKSTSDFRALYKFLPLYEGLKLVLIIAAAFSFGLSIKSVIWITVVSYAVAISPFLFKIFQELKIWRRGVGFEIFRFREIAKTLKTYGKWAVFNNIFSNFVTNVRPWLIKFFIGTEAVAIYSVALSFVSQLTSFLEFQKILGILAPREWANQERTERIYFRGIKYTTLASVLLIVTGSVGIYFLINIFYPKYLLSLPIFYIMILSLLHHGWSNGVNMVLTVEREQKFLFVQVVAKTLIALIGNTILLPIIGVYGAAWEYLLNVFLVTYFKYRRVKKIGPQFVLKLKQLFTIDQYDKEAFAHLKTYLKQTLLKKG